MKELSWNPALRGSVYCSPACGGGAGICDKSKYDLAVKKSKALAKRMGAGWKPHVWENLGWYYIVYKGDPINWTVGLFEISPPHEIGGTYTAWIQSSPQFIARHKNPKTALSLAIAEFDEHLSILNKQRKTIGKLV